MRRFAKDAFDAGTSVNMSEKAAEVVVEVASLAPGWATVDPLWSPPNGVRLY